jgi:hypothetical protein
MLLAASGVPIAVKRRVVEPVNKIKVLPVLSYTLVWSKLVYASVASNSITSTDADKLERIQENSAALSFNRFFPHVHYAYGLEHKIA